MKKSKLMRLFELENSLKSEQAKQYLSNWILGAASVYIDDIIWDHLLSEGMAYAEDIDYRESQISSNIPAVRP